MKGKRYTTEEKIRILREADRGEKSIQDSLPHSAAGAFDVPLLRASPDAERRTVKEAALGTVNGASALRVSPDRGIAAP
jgi:hypothetical protein